MKTPHTRAPWQRFGNIICDAETLPIAEILTRWEGPDRTDRARAGAQTRARLSAPPVGRGLYGGATKLTKFLK
jgi:hypothetical protein